MSIGLVGRKVGMTRIFTDSGDTLPVTVLDVSDNRITQIKSPDTDGYAAVQVTFGKRRASRVSKPLAGHLAKAAVEAGHTLREFRAKPEELAAFKVGGKIGVEISVGQKVDVAGVTVERVSGVIKRHHFPRSAVTATRFRTTSRARPARPRARRVFPGKRMAGHLGNEPHDAEPGGGSHRCGRQLLLVRRVPGSRGGRARAPRGEKLKRASWSSN